LYVKFNNYFSFILTLILSKDTTQSTRHNWRQIFDYDELNETNKGSTLWNEIHRPWWPTENSTNDPPKPLLE
jgi:hypothetical protein